MNNEQSNDKTTSGSASSPTGSKANTPVMDVVPPRPNEAGGSEVVSAPPEEVNELQISDEIAQQIAADSAPTDPKPAAESVPVPNPTLTQVIESKPEQAADPLHSESEKPESEKHDSPAQDAPNDIIQAEIEHQAAQPIAAVAKPPKVAHPVRNAVIATVFITIALSALAVYAYLASQPA